MKQLDAWAFSKVMIKARAPNFVRYAILLFCLNSLSSRKVEGFSQNLSFKYCLRWSLNNGQRDRWWYSSPVSLQWRHKCKSLELHNQLQLANGECGTKCGHWYSIIQRWLYQIFLKTKCGFYYAVHCIFPWTMVLRRSLHCMVIRLYRDRRKPYVGTIPYSFIMIWIIFNSTQQ